MVRTVLYVGDEFKDLDFDKISREDLVEKGFIESVGCLFKDKTKFDRESVIRDNKKICECSKSKLAVIYREEDEEKIVTYNYNVK